MLGYGLLGLCPNTFWDLSLDDFWEMVSAKQVWLGIQNGGEVPDYRTDEEIKMSYEQERKLLMQHYEKVKQWL